MPLIVLCGIPQSGKTRFATQLKEFLETLPNYRTILVNEETLGVSKSEAYASSFSEKNLRALLKSTVERELSRDTIVILDSMNYIKGYRYELFCLVRTVQTSHCVVYLDTSVQKASELNQEYSQELFQDLCNRMEVPEVKHRWDKPLVKVREDEAPFEEIKDKLFGGNKLRDPVSTKAAPKLESDYLYQTDQATQQVIDSILEVQNNYPEGSQVPLESLKVTYNYVREMSSLELKKARQQFLKMNKINPCPSASVPEAFIEYVHSLV